jgi:Trypsin-like peptidase domain/Effector-associated domain 1
MINYRLDRSLEAISITDDLRTTVYRLVWAAMAEGWIGSLVSAALQSRPNNAALLTFAERFGLAAGAPKLESLVGLKGEIASPVDIAVWRARLGALEAQVCGVQVESGDAMQYGTGFLVGPDLVLTSYHLVSSVIENRGRAREIRLLFDFRRLAGGGTINPGTICLPQEKDWLVAASPSMSTAGENALDYALLRAAGSPGNEPIRGDNAEPGAPQRGWITVPRRPFDLMPGSPLFILYRVLGGSLQVALDAEGVVGMDRTGARLLYKTNTEAGSTGAPCFDANWELIAMHEGNQGGVNQGLPISAIVRDLQSRGLSELLDTRLV